MWRFVFPCSGLLLDKVDDDDDDDLLKLLFFAVQVDMYVLSVQNSWVDSCCEPLTS